MAPSSDSSMDSALVVTTGGGKGETSNGLQMFGGDGDSAQDLRTRPRHLDWTSVGLTIAVAACCGPACLPQEAAALSRVSPR